MNVNQNTTNYNSYISDINSDVANWKTVSELKENQIIQTQKIASGSIFKRNAKELPVKLIAVVVPSSEPTMQKTGIFSKFITRSQEETIPASLSKTSLGEPNSSSDSVMKNFEAALALLTQERVKTLEHIENFQVKLQNDDHITDEVLDLAISTISKLKETMMLSTAGYDQLEKTYVGEKFNLDASASNKIKTLIESEKHTIQHASGKHIDDIILNIDCLKSNKKPIREMLTSTSRNYQLTTTTNLDNSVMVIMPKDFWMDFVRADFFCISDQPILMKSKIMKDYYVALNLPRTASKNEIGIALDRMEKTGKSADELSKAKEILLDPEKKIKYDFVLSQKEILAEPFTAYQRLLDQFQLTYGNEKGRIALQQIGRFMHQGLTADLTGETIAMFNKNNKDQLLTAKEYSSLCWNIDLLDGKIILELVFALKKRNLLFKEDDEVEKNNKEGMGIVRVLETPLKELLIKNLNTTEVPLPHLEVQDTYTPLSDASHFTVDYLDRHYLK